MENQDSFNLNGSSEEGFFSLENSEEEKKRLKMPRPKVFNEWRDEEIIQLIALVEERRPLWDKGCPNYKLPKDSLWQEIQDAFASTYQAPECKAKWANFRVTFNTNLAKYRYKKSGQGADEKFKIHWRFFNAMLFLESAQISQSTQSTSSMDILSPESDYSVLAELKAAACGAQPTSPTLLSAPSTPLPENTRKRSRPVECESSSLNYKLIAAQSLSALANPKPANKYQAFGEYIAAKLQSLPENEAALIERKIMRVLIEPLGNE